MNKLFYLFVLITLSSCGSFYEIVTTSSNSVNYENSSNSYIFKSKDLEISYNFWTSGGALFYTLKNTSDKVIIIDWSKSHIIINGLSSDYFNNASFSSTTSVGVSNTGIFNNLIGVSATTVKKGVVDTKSYVEKQYAHIPPNASIIIDKASLISQPIFDCDFNIKKPKLVNYNPINSPLKIRNYITYYKDSSQIQNIIDNDFYISSLEFISTSDFMGKQKSTKNCTVSGITTTELKHEFPKRSTNKFYIEIKIN